MADMLRIEGNSMLPFEEGWQLYSTPSTPEECLGHICIVELADGRRLFKRLMRGGEDGLYSLESLNPLFETIEDVEIVGAAKLKGVQVP